MVMRNHNTVLRSSLARKSNAVLQSLLVVTNETVYYRGLNN